VKADYQQAGADADDDGKQQKALRLAHRGDFTKEFNQLVAKVRK
jgi:hypothetical protein